MNDMMQVELQPMLAKLTLLEAALGDVPALHARIAHLESQLAVRRNDDFFTSAPRVCSLACTPARLGGVLAVPRGSASVTRV